MCYKRVTCQRGAPPMVSEAVRMFEEMGVRLLQPETTIAELRAVVLAGSEGAPRLDGEVVTDGAGPAGDGLWIRHQSTSPDTNAIVLWFHGGAYVAGHPQQVHGIGTALSA